jgi:hypothetical protein
MSPRVQHMLLAGALAALIRLVAGLTLGPSLGPIDLVIAGVGGAGLGLVGYRWMPRSRS